MPDHFRQQPKGAVAPRSPGEPDGPLALVIGNRHHDVEHHHHHQSPHSPSHQKSIRVQHGLEASSPGPSSGYSDHTGSPEHITAHFQPVVQEIEDKFARRHDRRDDIEVQEPLSDESMTEVPLALVVNKTKDFLTSGGDSGHEDGYSGGSSPILNRTSPRVERYAVNIPDLILKRKQEDNSESNNSRVEIQPDVTIAKIVKKSPIHESGSLKDETKSIDGSNKNSGIKIKDFARMSPTTELNHNIKPSVDEPINVPHFEEMSSDDVISEISSVDTWPLDGGSLRKQIVNSNGEILFACDFCDKTFNNKYHLQSHLVTHTGERNFSCPKCGKSFGRKSTLRAHMTTHTKTSNFMCPICEKACNDNNSLEEHIRMHTGEKPFVCSICSKAYARKSHLNVHYRVHTGERPFVCTECGKDFTEKRFLNDHTQAAHSGNDEPLKCPNCFREFAYKTSLKQHLRKQMCAKNINRSQGNVSHGNHTKQFQCPFCEKSYSWKQTLKQHVSMYHRNKIHTDEFWKYELAKHRRVGLDSSVNEDMWKKQLGRHAEDIEKNNNTIGSNRMNSIGDKNSSIGQEDRWLDQIQRSTTRTEQDRNQVANEMKILAFQSLQSSLHYMNMEMQKSLGSELKEPSISSQGTSNVLASKSNTTTNKELSTDLVNDETPQLSIRSPQPEFKLPDIKEEHPAKRTQMWLAQLGQYQQKSFLQDEMDRNHDELWEEQIARAKASPIKSPLEPVEITLDDEKEDNGQKSNTKESPIEANKAFNLARKSPIQVVNQQVNNGIGFPPLMSALQLFPPPAGFRPHSPPSATITRPGEQATIIIPKPKYPRQSIEINENDDQDRHECSKNKPLSLNNDLIPELTGQKEQIKCQETEKKDDKDKEDTFGSSSFLKSILMDRSGRKRPSIDPLTIAKPHPPKEDSHNDILRRRLLGLKDDAVCAPPPVKQPKATPPPTSVNKTSTITNNSGVNHSHLLVPPPPMAGNLHQISTRTSLANFVHYPSHQQPSTVLTYTNTNNNFNNNNVSNKMEIKPVVKLITTATARLPSPLSPMSPEKPPSDTDSHDTKKTTIDNNIGLIKANENSSCEKKLVDKEEDKCKSKPQDEALSLYAHTSVLKHLLYRYTESAHDQRT